MILTRAQKVRLGAFLVTGASVLVVVVLTLAGLKLWEPRTIYKTRFRENVGGLEPSAPVKYQGLRIGRVESMRIAADDPSAIEVVLALQPEAVVYEGSKAVLDSSGLTGLKTINITPGDPRKARLPANSMLPSGPSLMDKLTDSAEAIVADVRRVTDQITHWTSDENRYRIENLLAGLDLFIGHVDEMMLANRDPFGDALHRVTTAAANMTVAADEASKTLRVVRDGFGQAIVAVEETLTIMRQPFREIDPKAVAQTVHAMRGAAVSIDQRLSSREAGQALASVGDTIGHVNNLVQDVDIAVRAGREDFTATLNYLRQAAEDLREFSRVLAQNPSVLVRGREVRE